MLCTLEAVQPCRVCVTCSLAMSMGPHSHAVHVRGRAALQSMSGNTASFGRTIGCAAPQGLCVCVCTCVCVCAFVCAHVHVCKITEFCRAYEAMQPCLRVYYIMVPHTARARRWCVEAHRGGLAFQGFGPTYPPHESRVHRMVRGWCDAKHTRTRFSVHLDKVLLLPSARG